MPIAESPLAKHPVGKSDDLIAQFATQVFVVVFGGDVQRTEGVPPLPPFPPPLVLTYISLYNLVVVKKFQLRLLEGTYGWQSTIMEKST